MCRLDVQDRAIILVKVWDVVDATGILCGQSALLEKRQNIRHLIFSGKVLDIFEKLLSGNASQGVFDPVAVSLGGVVPELRMQD